MDHPASVDEVDALLARHNYLADRRLATALFLSLKLRRPLLLEGEAGVGKTEIAKVLAAALQTTLIRLQCYEGLDVTQAAYEWNVARQMLEIRLGEASGEARTGDFAQSLYRRELLIDELDRADEPFEAFLLEILSEYQMTIPELGPLSAEHPPIVIITSNRTREIHDALKRRCLYAWVDYPDAERELAIVRLKAPGANERLALQIVEFVQQARRLDLFKAPGVAETIDWTNALIALDAMSLDPQTVNDTLGVLLKYQDDIARMQTGDVSRILDELRARALID